MRLVPTANVQDGTELARDVLLGRRDGIPLLRAGVRINARFREGLMRVGIQAVYIEDGPSEGIVPEPLVGDHVRAEATRAVAGAYQDARQAILAKRPLPARAVQTLTQVVSQLIDEVASAGTASLALADHSCVAAYTLHHAIDVTALGLLIGHRAFRERGWVDYKGTRQFTRLDERLQTLGLGLMLADVGKLAVPVEIVNKPGKLTEAEWKVMQTHPRLGADLLQGDFSPLIKAVVLRHHERWDGTGYPDGKQGAEIHEMARIAAIADVYDAITSERAHAKAQPPCEGVRTIREGSGTRFDPELVGILSSLVPPFPPGESIELADGRRGIVASVPEDNLDRPVVRVISGPDAPYDVSLADDPAVRIAGWDATHEPVAA
jgi:HD-GYP domain-containing protein (c-di-GMP phosphodiesterase class II)